MTTTFPIPPPPIRANVKQGARGPSFVLRFWCENSDPDVDVSKYTGAVIAVTRLYDGTTATWNATPLSGATPALAAFAYVAAADGSDFATLGEYDLDIDYIDANGDRVPGDTAYLEIESRSRFRG